MDNKENKKKDIIGDLIKKKINDCLKTGEPVFWTQGLFDAVACNIAKIDNPYKPYNCILLSHHIYGTLDQWTKIGGKIDDIKKDKEIVLSHIPNYKIDEIKLKVLKDKGEITDEEEELIREFYERNRNNYDVMKEEIEKPNSVFYCWYGLKYNQVYALENVKGLDEDYVKKLKEKFDKLLERQNKITEIDADKSSIEKAEGIIDAYQKASGVKIVHMNMDSDGAAGEYYPLLHEIHIGNKEQYKNITTYYEVLFHEMAHSTARFIRESYQKGDEKPDIDETPSGERRAAEELVAEMTACGLLNYCNMDNQLQDKRNVAYIRGWNKTIKDLTGRRFCYGVMEAQKAYDYIKDAYEKSLLLELDKDNQKKTVKKKAKSNDIAI